MLIIRWIFFSLALLFIAWIVPGIFLTNFGAALLASLVIGIVNVFIRPALLVLTLPINILSLGLLTFIINAVLFAFVAYIVPGFEVNGILAALLGSVLLSILSVFVNQTEF